MREIEVKAKINDIDDFLTAAKKHGIRFGPPVTQKDSIYETTLPRDDPKWSIFRLRRQHDQIILNMKHKASTRSRDNYEYETTVQDEKEVVKMLNHLGFRHTININKVRRTAKYNSVEICLDEVERLGIFVEVEKLTDGSSDADQLQEELWALLVSLGLTQNDRVYKGYNTLIHELANN